MNELTYMQLLEGVAEYYGSGSDQWAEIAKYGISTPEAREILKQVPGVNIVTSESGKVLGYDYVKPFPNAVDSVTETAVTINSNVDVATYGNGSFNANLPSTVVTNPDTQVSTLVSGLKMTDSSLTVASVVKAVPLSLLAVSSGIQLGKLIDSAIYSTDPKWWDTHYPAINPETWGDMLIDNNDPTMSQYLLRSVFGTDSSNGKTTMYTDERLLAYTYMVLLANGAYDNGYEPVGIDLSVDTIVTRNDILQFNTFEEACSYCNYPTVGMDESDINYLNSIDMSDKVWMIYRSASIGTQYTNLRMICLVKKNSTYENFTSATVTNTDIYPVCEVTPYAGFTPGDGRHWFYDATANPPRVRYGGGGITNGRYVVSTTEDNLSNINALEVGSYTIVQGLDGVSDDPTATGIVPETLINPTTGVAVTPNDNVDDVLTALKNQYPDLFANSVYEDVMQDDGTVERYTYIPTPVPDISNIDEPVTGDNKQGNPSIDTQTSPEGLLQQITNLLTGTTTPPETGEGNSPVIIPPVGSASSLWRVYNPTQAQVDAFGAWLWSSNLVEQIKKLFNDPMQAIIGIHKVFASPSVGGVTTIKCGYIDSNVSSNYIDNQYSYIDCGTVDLREYFGNVFDYSPYTEVNLYLPFIGIVRLDTADVMRGTIGVKYSVDVITGACLAEVTVTRDGAGGIIYTFSGSAIVTYPLSSGSYVGAIGGVLSIAAGVAGTIATGGAVAPMALGALAGASRLHTDVQKSGSFTGCAGAMGVKKPYLIISRPQTAMADRFQHFTGIPSNSLVTLSACSGYTRVNSVHVESIQKATDEEKTRIEQLLKSGVTI